MDIKQLEIFLSVASSLNFTQAAQEHFMTQPAISHQISALERELDAKLFRRDSHSVSLTAAGEELIPHAKELVARARWAATRTHDVAHGKVGHLRILTVQSCVSVVSKCIEAYAELYPEVTIEADIVTGAAQMEAVRDQNTDILFSFQALLQCFSQLEHRVLAERPYCLLLPSDQERPIDPSDFTSLQDLPLICEKDSEAPFLVGKAQEICANRGLKHPNIRWCNTGNSILLAVRSGLGFAILPAPYDGKDTEGIRSVPLTGPDASVDDTIGWFSKTGNPAALDFVDLATTLF